MSSRIEGTQTTQLELFAHEATEHRTPTEAVLEVQNYVAALELGLSQLEKLGACKRLIRNIHERLLHDVRGRHRAPGAFRSVSVRIGGTDPGNATYVPPPAQEVEPLMDALERYIHTPSSLPPLIRLALIHYNFEAIHPFLDGNGRVGRLLLTVLLHAWGLLPHPILHLSAYFERERDAYYRLLLAVSQRGAWEPWIEFFLQGVALESRDAITRCRRLLDLRESYRHRFQTARSGRLLHLIDLLFARPVVTIGGASVELGVGFVPAQRHIERLEREKVLVEMTGGQRYRVYMAPEIVRIIAPEDFPEDPGGE